MRPAAVGDTAPLWFPIRAESLNESGRIRRSTATWLRLDVRRGRGAGSGTGRAGERESGRPRSARHTGRRLVRFRSRAIPARGGEPRPVAVESTTAPRRPGSSPRRLNADDRRRAPAPDDDRPGAARRQNRTWSAGPQRQRRLPQHDEPRRAVLPRRNLPRRWCAARPGCARATPRLAPDFPAPHRADIARLHDQRPGRIAGRGAAIRTRRRHGEGEDRGAGIRCPPRLGGRRPASLSP